MSDAALEVLIAPALVAAATLSARRWGPRIGGLVSAFPAIVGPVLLISAQEHGEAFAAHAATGTLLGLVALSSFALAYGRTAAGSRWPASFVSGWVAAAIAAATVGALGAGLPGALVAASVSLFVAHRLLPRGAAATDAPPVPRWDLPLRLVLTAALVVVLSAAAGALGAVVGGILAALPVLASVLAVFTHEQAGSAALADLLRGMLAGMAGFVTFCALVALLIEPAGVGVAFAAATLGAVVAQLAAATPAPAAWPWGRRDTSRPRRPRSSPASS